MLLGVDSLESPGTPNSLRSSWRIVSSLRVVLGLTDLGPPASEEAADEEDWSRDRSVRGESIPLSSLVLRLFKVKLVKLGMFLNQSYLMMWVLVFYLLLRITVVNLTAFLFFSCVTYQRILLGHIAICCFVFSDRFYGRKSDNFLEDFIQLIDGTQSIRTIDLKKRKNIIEFV